MIDPDEDLIRPTAARFSRRYRMVERDDIAQELRLWWIEHQRTVKRYLESEERDERGKLQTALNREAEKYCRAIKAQVEGYKPDDEYFYTSGQVRELLPLVFKPELMVQDTQPDEGGRIKSGKPANEGNNLQAMVQDVARGLEALSGEQRRLIEDVFLFGETNDSLADRLEISVDAAKMRVQRAIDSLIRNLGGKSPYVDHDGPGNRHAISNAHAIALTGNQETGE